MTDLSSLLERHQLSAPVQAPLAYLLHRCARDNDGRVQERELPTLWEAAAHAPLEGEDTGALLLASIRRWHVAESDYPIDIIPLAGAETNTLTRLPRQEVAAGLLLARGIDPFKGVSPYAVFSEATSRGFYHVATALLEHPQFPSLQTIVPAVIAESGWQVFTRCPAFLKVALEKGLDPNIPNAKNATALFFASNGSAVKQLMEAGADPNHRSSSGHTPLEHWIISKAPNTLQMRSALSKNSKSELNVDGVIFTAMRNGKAQDLAIAMRGNPLALEQAEERGGVALNVLDAASEGVLLRYNGRSNSVGSALVEKVLSARDWDAPSLFVLNAALEPGRKSSRCASNAAFSQLAKHARDLLLDGPNEGRIPIEAARKWGVMEHRPCKTDALGFFEKFIPTNATDEDTHQLAVVMHQNALKHFPATTGQLQAMRSPNSGFILSYMERCARFSSSLLTTEEKWQQVFLGLVGAFSEYGYAGSALTSQATSWKTALEKLPISSPSEWAQKNAFVVQHAVKHSNINSPARLEALHLLEQIVLTASIPAPQSRSKTRM